MRILYIDVDSLRADHLGCYGYHRDTSPNIDRVASDGVVFRQCYASDMPCCPSRTALFLNRFGINNGVVCHAGTAAEPFSDGPRRSFQDSIGRTSLMSRLRKAGYRTAAISSFGERHSAWWWYAGFGEVVNTGKCGMEIAEEVTPEALRWIEDRGAEENWFVHVNFWDSHTPYRTPESFGNPFANAPLPPWLSEEVRRTHFERGVGPQCARERGDVMGIDEHKGRYPRQPYVMDSMEQVRRMFDGYDTAIRYVDEQIGVLLGKLEEMGLLDETAILLSADHGECLGEVNIYGCHQTADAVTSRLPLVIRWPGLPGATGGRTDDALHYHIDWGATVADLVGAAPADNWDGRSFADALRSATPRGRDHLVLSQMQGACQRSVRFDRAGKRWFFTRTWHDGYHGLDERQLHEIVTDPHQQNNLIDEHPDIAAEAGQILHNWTEAQLASSGRDDPMQRVLAEGGPPHSRSVLPRYLERLRATGRDEWAERFQSRSKPVGA